MNLQGSIDLLKLDLTAVVTLHDKRCVVIPVDENDIYVTNDQQTGKPAHAYLGVDILERREPNKYGKTHYAKPSISKALRERDPQRAEAKKSVYFGDFKPLTFDRAAPATTSAPIANAPSMDGGTDEQLPF